MQLRCSKWQVVGTVKLTNWATNTEDSFLFNIESRFYEEAEKHPIYLDMVKLMKIILNVIQKPWTLQTSATIILYYIILIYLLL